MRSSLLLLLLLWCSMLAAQQAPPAQPLPADAPVLDTVVVSGKLPGPGLWKVSRDGHTLWLLGTMSPLPRRMEWDSHELERVLDRAGLLLMPPEVRLDADIGPLRALFLLPSLYAARRNPDDARLEDVLPPELHARWRELKQRYLRGHRGVERWRPIFAASELYERVLDRAGLERSARVVKRVEKLAKKRKLAREEPELVLKLEDPKQAIRDFRDTGIDDQACFARVLERVEVDMRHVQARANAWAVGDLDTLRQLPENDAAAACLAAMLGAEAMAKRGFDDLPERARALWLDAAERAIATHETSVGLLRIDLLLAEDGWLQALAGRGYTVEAPDAAPASETCDGCAGEATDE